MKSRDLRRIFRGVLAFSVLPSASFVACGGAVTDPAIGEEPQGPTGQRPPTVTSGGGSVPGKPPPVNPPTKVDASASDAEVILEASVDAKPKDAAPDAPCDPNPAPPDPPDANGDCMWSVPLPCSVAMDASANMSQEECQAYCGFSAFWCYPQQGWLPDGAPTSNWTLQCVSCVVGRRPEGYALELACDDEANPVGNFFAVCAELEAASVFSFERLENELAAYGAPEELRARARRAANDEKRHARVTASLAKRYGAKARAPKKAPTDVRPLADFALENAVEGCVRETFGALTATVQAERASDPRVRAAMKRIARDETEHAALAWSVASHLISELDDETRLRLQSAMADAIAELERELAIEPPVALRTIAGLPSKEEASAMLGGMRELLWAA